MTKETKARIKINKKLEESGWRFEADKNGLANIRLEAGPERRRGRFGE